MVTAVNNSNSSTSSPVASAATISTDAGQDRFLKLLVAQMKNQDPLNPMDNAQVTSQLAQINTVQGITQLNQVVGNLLAQSQGQQAMSLAGHQVLVPGNTLTLTTSTSGATAQGGFDIPADAQKVVVTVKDATGAIVKQIDLGAQTAGTGTFTWDGTTTASRAAAGSYKFEVNAYNSGTATAGTALASGKVLGVTPSAQGAVIFVEGAGKIAFSDVKMVL